MEAFLSLYEKYAKVRKPRNAFKCTTKLAEEVGEVAEAVLACSGNAKKTNKILAEGSDPLVRLSEELGDVIIASLHIAHTNGIDKKTLFEKAAAKMESKIAKKTAAKNEKNQTPP